MADDTAALAEAIRKKRRVPVDAAGVVAALKAAPAAPAPPGFLLRNLPNLLHPRGDGMGDLSQLAVERVLDGDTFDVRHNDTSRRVRLHAVDAPEKGQAYGPESKAYTGGKLEGRRVSVRERDRDKYGRTVGVATSDDKRNLNEDLTREGLAWWYRQFGKGEQRIQVAEQTAKDARRGLWAQSSPTPPWAYRHTGKGAKAPEAPVVTSRSARAPAAAAGAAVDDTAALAAAIKARRVSGRGPRPPMQQVGPPARFANKRPEPGAPPGAMRKSTPADEVKRREQEFEANVKAANQSGFTGVVNRGLRAAAPVLDAASHLAPNMRAVLNNPQGKASELDAAFLKDFSVLRAAGLAAKLVGGGYALTKAGAAWATKQGGGTRGPVTAFLMRRLNPGEVAGAVVGAGGAQVGANVTTGQPAGRGVSEAVAAGVVGHVGLGVLGEGASGLLKRIKRGAKGARVPPVSAAAESKAPRRLVETIRGWEERSSVPARGSAVPVQTVRGEKLRAAERARAAELARQMAPGARPQLNSGKAVKVSPSWGQVGRPKSTAAPVERYRVTRGQEWPADRPPPSGRTGPGRYSPADVLRQESEDYLGRSVPPPLRRGLGAPKVGAAAAESSVVPPAPTRPELAKGAVAFHSGGDGLRLVREARYLFQTAPHYLERLGEGGQALAREVRKFGQAQGQGATAGVLRELAEREHGTDFAGLESHLVKIGKEFSPAEADRARRFILGDILEVPAHVKPLSLGGKVAVGLTNYQALSKLGARPATTMRNWSQRFTNSGLEYGHAPVAQAQFEMMAKPWRSASKSLWDKAKEAGVFESETEATANLKSRFSKALLAGFDQAETGNRFVAARTRQIGLERDMALLTKLKGQSPAAKRLQAVFTLGAGTEGAAVRRLERSGMTAREVRSLVASGQPIPVERIQEAMVRAVRDEQFAMDLVSSPMWWQNAPWLRVAGQFKGFAVKQMMLTYNVVGKEAAKGNFAPLGRYVAGTLVAGEAYNALRDLAFGGDRSVSAHLRKAGEQGEDPEARVIARRMLTNFKSGGGLGLFSDLVLGGGPDETWEQVAGLVVDGDREGAREKAGRVVKQQAAGLLGGPSLRTAQNVAGAARGLTGKQDPEERRRRLVELLKQEVPAARDAGGLARRVEKWRDGR